MGEKKATLRIYVDFICPKCKGNFGKRLKVYFKRGRRNNPDRLLIEEVQEIFCPECKIFYPIGEFDFSFNWRKE